MHALVLAADALNAQQFGAYGVTLAGSWVVIGWLVRKLAKAEATKDELHDRLLAQSEKLIPIAEHLGSVTDSAYQAMVAMQAELAARDRK